MVLVLLVCAAVALGLFFFVDGAGAKTQVLVLSRRVPESAVITRADLTSVALSGDVASVPARDADQVVGRRALHTMEAGTVVQARALSPQGAGAAAGLASVGIAVPAGLAPHGLQSGERVRVLQLPERETGSGSGDFEAPASATTLADGALITNVTEDPSTSGGLVVTVEVATNSAGPLLVASSRGQVGVVRVSGS